MKFRIDLKILFFLVLFLITGQIKLYFIVMIFALLHELAHLITGLILGFKLQEIELIPFGFWIRLKPKIKDYNVLGFFEKRCGFNDRAFILFSSFSFISSSFLTFIISIISFFGLFVTVAFGYKFYFNYLFPVLLLFY